MGRTSVVRARSSRARPGVTGSPGPANSALDCRLAGRVGTAIRSGMAALLSGCDAGRSNRTGPACADRFPIVSGRALVSPAATSPRISRSRLLRLGSWSATRPAVVARVGGISRQAVYRRLSRRPWAAGPGRAGLDDQVIVEVARANPTDGTRMVAALASRELGRPVNRKRVQRVMRAHRLLQPSRSDGRRRRPGFFRVARPDALWHLDMTKVWTPRKATACRHRR